MRTMVIAMLLLVAVGATAATHTVTQSGVSFSPAEITITVGDTVEWVWTSGFHTVTNGTGAADPNAGTLFDFNFSGDNVAYEFTAAGDYPYFCRPHESMGMTGMIHVVSQVSSESSTFSDVKNLFR